MKFADGVKIMFFLQREWIALNAWEPHAILLNRWMWLYANWSQVRRWYNWHFIEFDWFSYEEEMTRTQGDIRLIEGNPETFEPKLWMWNIQIRHVTEIKFAYDTQREMLHLFTRFDKKWTFIHLLRSNRSINCNYTLNIFQAVHVISLY